MKELSVANFGILIAYLLPGVTALWGLSYWSPTVQAWLGTETTTTNPTVAGFLYVTLAAIAAGLIVSAVRSMTVDTVHKWTQLTRPEFNYADLANKIAGFDVLVRHHYDYYKFHGNMLVAVVFAYAARRASLGWFTLPVGWFDLGVLGLAATYEVHSQ